MRTLSTKIIAEKVAEICIDSNYHLGSDVLDALKAGRNQESSATGKVILDQILENARIAEEGNFPLCQDTGLAVFFVEYGQDVHLIDGSLQEAINEGVRLGYAKGFLRKSIVKDPFRRENTGDNTPAVIWTEIVPGDRVKITVAPKGGGSENMSEVAMLKPADGVEGAKAFIIDKVCRSGGNPCPPIIVGVGIGGTFEKVSWLAKKSLLRTVGTRNPDPFYADLERDLLQKINNLGIGPQGLGGKITALDLFIEVHPCHIASMPVAVNMQCHAARHKSVVL